MVRRVEEAAYMVRNTTADDEVTIDVVNGSGPLVLYRRSRTAVVDLTRRGPRCQ